MKDFPILKIDNNLKLTMPSAKFVADLLEVYQNETTLRFMNCKNDISYADVEKRIELLKKNYENSKQLYWVIYSSEFSKAIGYITIFFHSNFWQLEYALNENFWNQGIMYRCLKKSIRFIKENTDFNILAVVNTDNHASIKILEKLKFVMTGEGKNKSDFPSTEFVYFFKK